MSIDLGYEILNYAKMDLSKFSDEQLKSILEEETRRKQIGHTNQLNRKILINSLYGATGSAYFRLYSVINAEATTSFGQVAIKWVQKAMNEYLNKANKTVDQDYIIYIDTDSVVGDTMIYVNDKQIKISDYFDSISNENIVRNNYKDYVKNITNDDVCKSVNTTTNKIENNQINYIMKHKVNKRMFNIKVDGKVVKVTEDHSIMVMRDDKIISVKPLEIIKGDGIIKLN